MSTVIRIGLTLVCAVLMISGTAPGQDVLSPLTVYGGVTVFNNPAYDSVAVVKFPFSLKRDQFEFYQLDSTSEALYARAFVQVDLINFEGRVVDSANTVFSIKALDRSEATRQGYRVFNTFQMLVPPGLYSIRWTAVDIVSKRQGEMYLSQVNVPPPVMGRLSLSGIRTAYSMRYVGDSAFEGNPRLVRSGYSIIPNPLSVYGTEDSAVYLYAEVYNLQYSDGDTSRYRVSLAAMTEGGGVYRDYGSRRLRKPAVSAAIAESFDIRGWPEGLYDIRLSVLDMQSGEADTAVIPFRIVPPIDPGMPVEGQPEFDPYDTLSLQVRQDMLSYFLTPDQKITLESLNDAGKEVYLSQFWKERQGPESPENQFLPHSVREVPGRTELMRRFEESNRLYSSDDRKTNGWKSDLGRVLIMYGYPDDIFDVPSPRVRAPYQVWTYLRIKEGKFFVFEDTRRNDDYELVHSNVYGEIYSKDWQEAIEAGEVEVAGY